MTFYYGSPGNDNYHGSSSADGIYGALGNDSLYGGGGNDEIDGQDGDDQLFGEAGNDRMWGGNGNDQLDGGTGNDTMEGGAGHDLYKVNSTSDQVIEGSNAGKDRVVATVSYALTANIEELILSGTGSMTGEGNDLANEIKGNLGHSLLYGYGGNDVMYGGPGTGLSSWPPTDTGAPKPPVGKWPNQADGNDTMYGGSGNDSMYGGGGDDILSGDTGDDSMFGGSGNDIYYIDTANDRITEYASEGTDTVYSSVAYTLGTDVENLSLSGAGNIAGTGNVVANVIIGNNGANTLKGLDGNDRIEGGGGNDTIYGGKGNDTLSGDSGQDFFVFDTTLNASTNVDTIANFSALDDTIRLDNDIFTKMGFTGSPTSSSFFRVGTAAGDSNDRIIYDSSTGNLYYDADGSGGGSAIKFAVIDGAPSITYKDFNVIE